MTTGIPTDLVPLATSPWEVRPADLPLDIEECRTALWETQGNITKAAELLKVSPGRLRTFVKNSEYLTREALEAEEVIKDIAEGNIVEALSDPADAGRRDTMSRWFLERKGKDRGYSTSGGVNINPSGLKGRVMVVWEGEPTPAAPTPVETIDVTPRKVANDV